jgi:hypothetical protein
LRNCNRRLIVKQRLIDRRHLGSLVHVVGHTHLL